MVAVSNTRQDRLSWVESRHSDLGFLCITGSFAPQTKFFGCMRPCTQSALLGRAKTIVYWSSLLEWPTKLRQHPHRKQKHTKQGLHTCDDSGPALGSKRVLVRLQTLDPITRSELLEADVHGR